VTPATDQLVVLTAAFRLFALTSVSDGAARRLVPLADPRLSSPPTAMALLEHPAPPDADGGPAERPAWGDWTRQKK
ncbi:MAG: hypothetical protein VXY90_00690, partial [Pseudomonadota bacterium]|nr:hypothetical protein [Pseudomonadota bacterium]